MSDVSENNKTRLIDENDFAPLTNEDILEIMEGDGDPNLPPDMPSDYEGDVTDEDIWKMLEE